MSGAKEIRSKIRSIQSTQKITRAMEMVAASKMRKSQERMRASRPYAQSIRSVVAHLATGQLEYQHPYLIERPLKRVGLIVISTDRGLCGGLNINLFRLAIQSIRAWHDDHIEIEICTVGRKAENFFRRVGGNIVASVSQLGDKPGVEDIIGAVNIMMESYDEQRIDELYLIGNEFINTMTQKPRLEKLLPILPKPAEENSKTEKKEYSWDYIYEPDAKALLTALLIRYLESLVYQAVIENIACEQAARMVAMKNASDNATNLIADLQLVYNKARQASITRELSEIVAGAAAV